MKPEYDLSKMKSRKNPYSKEIDYTDEPMGDAKVIPDFLPPAAEIVEGFEALEKQREGKQ